MNETISIFRRCLSVGLVSLVAIGLELTLMRILALLYWQHFAYMTISVALLGFGAAGTTLTILRRFSEINRLKYMRYLALGLAVGTPLTGLLIPIIPLDVQFLAWDWHQVWPILIIELLMFIPFCLGGGFIALALMGHREGMAGIYSANLIGSAVGAILTIGLMFVLLPNHLLLIFVIPAVIASGLLAFPGQDTRRIFYAGHVLIIVVSIFFIRDNSIHLSPYRYLARLGDIAGVKTEYLGTGPQGILHLAWGDAIHVSPGVSLQSPYIVPPHVLLLHDGDAAHPVYKCKTRMDWAFMDWTTPAAAYRYGENPDVCIVGAGGGSQIGLALYHRSRRVEALEINRSVIRTMAGRLRQYSGNIYGHECVRVIPRDARAYFTLHPSTYDIIHLPPLSAFTSSGAGLHAGNECYLYTVEAFVDMLKALRPNGVLCVTSWARTPPRDGLRLFDTAVQALRCLDYDPGPCVRIIRSLWTVSILVSIKPPETSTLERLKQFSTTRGFDMAGFAGLRPDEINRFHVLNEPYYAQAAVELVGDGRDAYLNRYLFHITATTDDQPYFFRFGKWSSLRELWEQLGQSIRAFLEIGYLLHGVALIQVTGLAVVFILLPLGCGNSLVGTPFVRRWPILVYFAALGLGFMLLETAFLQKLILFLAYPVYAVAMAIAAFLAFAGVGSWLTTRQWPLSKVAAYIVAGISLAYAMGLGPWLSLWQGTPVSLRFVIAGLTIAPLAIPMGMLFPAGLHRISRAGQSMIPWAWAINGTFSVTAVVATPLLAMQWGFSRVVLIAVVCYAIAGCTFFFLQPADHT